jgi:hypothetical protein
MRVREWREETPHLEKSLSELHTAALARYKILFFFAPLELIGALRGKALRRKVLRRKAPHATPATCT